MVVLKNDIIVVGGGAAGFFAAINAAEKAPNSRVLLLEKSLQCLGKVKISGGGRCNVTHACFEPRELAKYYPRGEQALIAPFSRFNPLHTQAWFEARGVRLKTEADNRMFPQSNNSQTIVDCLTSAAHEAGVRVLTQSAVRAITPPTKQGDAWQLQIAQKGEHITTQQLLIAGGSSSTLWQQIAQLGHTIVPPVPSLFTFNIPNDNRLTDMAGVAIPHTRLSVQIGKQKIRTEGALLITHWGVSGPAVLRMSAWGARILHEANYQFQLVVNWLPNYSPEELTKLLDNAKQHTARKQVISTPLGGLPTRLWKKLTLAAAISEDMRWADLSKKHRQQLQEQLSQSSFQVMGKSTFKDEFVTCGGVHLKEVNFKTMESKLIPSLYFAGEILDIDGITGGFNFQAAWTCGWIAGTSMAETILANR